jgi:hypothetical protein
VSRFFEHRQVYRLQAHNAKLELSLRSPIHRHLSPLRGYLTAVQRDFPHHLFQNTAERSSTFPAQLQPAMSHKENHATGFAALVLPTSPNNKKRHETLQRFMLVNDSVTVAVEVPVFLTQEDIRYYRSRGFDLDFESDVITGHTDCRTSLPLKFFKCGWFDDWTILISSRSRVSTDAETKVEKSGKGMGMPVVRLLPHTFAKSRACVHETH